MGAGFLSYLSSYGELRELLQKKSISGLSKFSLTDLLEQEDFSVQQNQKMR